MFDVRLRMFEGTGTKGRVLRESSLTASIQESGAASLKFTVSQRVAGRLVAPFLVGVEYSTGGAYTQPRNGLFIVTEEGSDTADGSKTVEFTGMPFVPWLLGGMHQRFNAYTGARYLGDKTEWPNATPGRILRSLIDHGQTVDGWAPMLVADFTATTDSAGVAWTAAERWSPEFRALTSIVDVLGAHTDSGLLDWWTEGTKLRAFRPGTGTSYPNVKLGGPGFQRMPVKRQFAGQFNFLTVIAEDGNRYYANPGADETYGRRHATATLSGVKLADADRIVAPMLVEGRTPKRELSYEWTPAGGLPVPWVDFQVGDGVQARDRDGWAEQRVLGVTVQKTDAAVTVRATVGAKLLNRLKRAVQRVEGGSLGQITGGTGVTVPVVSPVASAAPDVPGALHVVSNTAVWGEDGSARTTIKLAWDAVLETTDGAELDAATYEVWGRLGSEASARVTSTDALSFTVEGWEPDVTRYVKVRALDRDGRPGGFSGEIAVTPVMPASIVPKAPTGLVVPLGVASFFPDGSVQSSAIVQWDAVTESVDGAPVTVVEYEVSSPGFAPWRTASTGQVVVWRTGVLPVQVRARSSLGVWSDPASITVPAQTPAVLTAAPSTPVVAAGMGGVTYRWDGLSSTGVVMPSGFARVVVDSGASSAGPWTPLGATLTGAGGGSIPAAVDAEVFVRFRAFDTLGRPMGTSVVVSAVAAGVTLDDIPGLEADLDGIRYTADGKNRVYVQVGEPEGDLSNLLPNPGLVPGTGTVEVRRNHKVNPIPSSSADYSGANGATVIYVTSPYEAIEVAAPDGTPTDRGVQIFNRGGWAVGESWTVSMDVEAVTAGTYRFTTTGGGLTVVDGATSHVFTAGEKKRIHVAYSVSAAVAGAVYFVRSDGVASTFRVSQVLIERTRILGAYFDHTFSPDPDLTASATGTPGASPSILTGVPVDGWSANSYLVAIKSSRGGRDAIRVLRTGPGNSSVTYTVSGGAFGSPRYTGLLSLWRDAAVQSASSVSVADMERAAGTWEGASIIRNDELPPVGEWKAYRLTRDFATNNVRFLLRPPADVGESFWYSGAGLYEGVYDGPWTQKFAQGDLWFQLDATGTSVVAVKVWDGTAWAPQVLYADSILAAESITSPLIRAGAIEVNHASPSFGGDLNLAANDSINLLVGRVDANQDALTSQQVQVDAQAAQIAATQAVADAAASGAAEAGIAAAAAQAAAAAAQAGVDQYGTVFAFEADGFSISSPGSPRSVKLTDENIAIRRNGVAQTLWDEQQMIVPKLKTAQVIVGQTVITEGAGRTTWQRL